MRPLALLLPLVLIGAATAASAADLDDLTRLFAGRFDSREQWDMEDAADVPEAERHPWTTAIHTPIATVAPHSFHVEEFRDGKPERVTRRRVVTFAADGDGIRMRQFEIADLVVKPESITPDRLTPLTGCDVVWRRNEKDLWEGRIAAGECRVPAAGRPQVAQFEATLTALLYQRVDRTLYADTGARASGAVDELPTVLRRVTDLP